MYVYAMLPLSMPITKQTRVFSKAASAGLCALACAGFAQAQQYPSKPIRLVLGFPPGTTIDVMVRPIAPRMSEALGQQVVVDNRPGATGLIANEHVAKSPGDGYTLLAAPGSSLTALPHLRLKMPYDPLKD